MFNRMLNIAAWDPIGLRAGYFLTGGWGNCSCSPPSRVYGGPANNLWRQARPASSCASLLERAFQ